jgi:signal transduction histidine kinase
MDDRGQLPPEVSSWIADSLFEQAPISIAVISADLEVVAANSNFVAVFGPSVDRPCFEVYKKRDRPCPACPVQKTLRDGKSRISDEQGIDVIGQRASLVVHHSPVHDEAEEVTHVVNMSYDVTDRKTLQHQYNLIFERAPCALSVINRDFRITRANENVREHYGEATGERCYQIYKGRETRCEACPALETFSDGLQHTAKQMRRASDGSYTYHIVSTAPLPFGDRGVSHVVEMSLDVTEAHVLSEKLLESERLATVGHTVTQLAHSIKNILTGLQGGIYDIKTGQRLGDPSRAEEGLETLSRNYQRITELVRDFLRFSKEHQPDVALTDPNAVAEAIYALYRKISEKYGISFVFEPCPGIEPAWIDPRALHTCLTNLVANAFEACAQREEQEGTRTGCSIALRVCEEDEMIVFEVEDTGCGMDRSVQDRIFRGIFTTKGPSGTGLGLVMVKKVVEDHGGTIHVRSTPGEGSLFRIELPRSALPNTGHAQAVAASGRGGSGGRGREPRTAGRACPNEKENNHG